MTDFFLIISIIILCLAFVCLYRAVFGPTIVDRMIAVNVIGTKTVTVILLMGFIFHNVDFFIDISIVYALINFIGTVAFSKYFEKRGVL